MPTLSTAEWARCIVGVATFYEPQLSGRRGVDVVTDFLRQLRLVGSQVTEQGAGLSFTDVKSAPVIEPGDDLIF